MHRLDISAQLLILKLSWTHTPKWLNDLKNPWGMDYNGPRAYSWQLPVKKNTEMLTYPFEFFMQVNVDHSGQLYKMNNIHVFYLLPFLSEGNQLKHV